MASISRILDCSFYDAFHSFYKLNLLHGRLRCTYANKITRRNTLALLYELIDSLLRNRFDGMVSILGKNVYLWYVPLSAASCLLPRHVFLPFLTIWLLLIRCLSTELVSILLQELLPASMFLNRLETRKL